MANEYDAVIEAKQAELHFDLAAKVVRVTLDHAEMQHLDRNSDVALINNNILEMPIPPNSHFNMDKKIQEFTNKEIIVELVRKSSQAQDGATNDRRSRRDSLSPPVESNESTGARCNKPSCSTVPGSADATSSRPSSSFVSRWRWVACCS